ncbi:MAG: NERD domain-containing protein [Actinobacteria bacterium]|nr:NERD domain-containing protein [Actinomycetota bacterium]
MTNLNQDRKRLKLRRDGICSVCGVPLQAGTLALWSASQKVVSCITHAETSIYMEENLESEVATEPPTESDKPVSQGTAGGSARAENERRVKQREERVTKRFPRAGKYILALTDEPQSTRAWEAGAEGEVAIGKLLDSLAIKYGFRVLHDRLIPKSRANIDHIAITRFGIFVIDAKNYQGVVRIKDKSGFFEKSAPELWVGRRNCMKLVEGMNKQTSIVKEILNRNSIEMPVQGILAFYAADWETFKFLRKQEEVDGVLINSKGIESIVSREGTFSAADVDAAVKLLAITLVSAA